MKQHLKATIVVSFIAFLCVWAFKSFVSPKFSEGPSTAYSNLETMKVEGVPNIKATDLSGASFDLESLQGKVVILNFWASWCAPCVEEVPSLVRLVKEFKGDVQLIAVSGDSSLEDINVFLKSFPELKDINIRIVWDQDRSLMKQFNIARLPESLVLDKHHKLAKKMVGAIDWYNKDSISYIVALQKK